MGLLSRIYSLSDDNLEELQVAILDEIQRRKGATQTAAMPEPVPAEEPPRIVPMIKRPPAPLSRRRRAA